MTASTASTLAANLKRMRVAARLSQEAVATLAGLTRVAYTRIESAAAAPRAATLTAIAKALGVSLADLLAPPLEVGGVRFRSLKHAARDHVLAIVARKLDEVRMLEECADDPKPFKLASIRAAGSGLDHARELARGVRKTLKLHEQQPVRDICGTLEDAGVTVLTLDIRADDLFGLSIAPSPDRGPVIIVNAADHISVERCIFTTAHEFGHLVLHHQDYRQDEADEDKQHEAEANAFAGEFLMPDTAFLTEWKRFTGFSLVDRVLAVKRVFGVSYMTVLYRLHEKGLKDVFANFRGQFKARHGRSLLKADEPHALQRDRFRPDIGAAVEDLRADEPEAMRRIDFVEPRLHGLVRKCIEREAISMSRAAEILGKTLTEMRAIAASWADSDVDNAVHR